MGRIVSNSNCYGSSMCVRFDVFVAHLPIEFDNSGGITIYCGQELEC